MTMTDETPGVNSEPGSEKDFGRRIQSAGLIAIPVSEEDWFKSYWRPAAAWTYLFICTFDFVLAPIVWAWFSWFARANPISMWVPLTIQGGAIFHLSFGAIIGITAWGRSRERMTVIDQVLAK